MYTSHLIWQNTPLFYTFCQIHSGCVFASGKNCSIPNNSLLWKAIIFLKYRHTSCSCFIGINILPYKCWDFHEIFNMFLQNSIFFFVLMILEISFIIKERKLCARCVLLPNYVDVTDSLRHSQDVWLFRPYPLFVGRFGHSLRFYNLEFDEKAISDGFMAHSRVFRGFWISRNFRELSFCGPYGPCFTIQNSCCWNVKTYMLIVLICLWWEFKLFRKEEFNGSWINLQFSDQVC